MSREKAFYTVADLVHLSPLHPVRVESALAHFAHPMGEESAAMTSIHRETAESSLRLVFETQKATGLTPQLVDTLSTGRRFWGQFKRLAGSCGRRS